MLPYSFAEHRLNIVLQGYLSYLTEDLVEAVSV
jgi:hypothetical protein